MTPMTEPTTEELEMAREIVKQTLTPESHKRCNCRAEIDAGEWDHGHKMRIALAAIRATTEKAATFIDRCNREGPYNAIGAAERLRAGQHLETTE